jgi:GNAT superfamily N-acetyltransferase
MKITHGSRSGWRPWTRRSRPKCGRLYSSVWYVLLAPSERRPFEQSSVIIRPEQAGDVAAIYAVHVSAFPTDAEARLVDALRAVGRLSVTLFVEDGGRIVGHVAFSPVSLAGAAGGLGLAPLAVIPDRQRTGIGGRLVREGLAVAAPAGSGSDEADLPRACGSIVAARNGTNIPSSTIWRYSSNRTRAIRAFATRPKAQRMRFWKAHMPHVTPLVAREIV